MDDPTSVEPTDVTQLRPARVERAFWAIFNRAANPMLVVNDDRRYLAVNEAAVRFLGHSREQLLTMRIDDLTPPEEVAQLPATWEDFLARGGMNGCYELVTAGGERVTVDYNATANVLPGRHLSIFIVTPAEPNAEPAPSDPTRVVTNQPRRAGTALTAREREVLQLLAEGATSSQAAERLTISEETVKSHVTNARRKLGASTRAQAIALALRDGDLMLEG